MTIDLEKKVIAYFLDKPKSITLYEFSQEWMTDKTHREVAYGLEVLQGEFDDFSVLVETIKDRYPFTTVTSDWLDTEKYAAYSVTSIKDSVQVLKRSYLKGKVREASKAYHDYPSEKHYDSMQQAISALNDSEETEDDGSIHEASELLDWELENEKISGIKTFEELDHILGDGLEGGRLITVGGRPGTGKTAWGINVIVNALSKQPDVLIDLYSLEMTKIHMLKRFISRLAEINSYKLKNPKKMLNNTEKERVIRQNKYLVSTGVRILDKVSKISEIERQITRRRNENEGKRFLVIIDYLQLIDHESKAHNRQAQIGEVTRRLKKLANRLDIPIIMFSQLSRNSETKEKPTMTDLRESGDIEQDSDIIGLMHADSEDENTIFFEVAKNRDGRVGTLTYTFFKPHMFFGEVKHD